MAAELYLIRHGIAADRDDAWPDDDNRPLTAKGTRHLREIASGLTTIDVNFDVVITSPLLRARQTADVIVGGLSPRPPIEVSAALSPGSAHSAVLEELAPRARFKRIALVGHEPGMGVLAARLIGSRHSLEFKKGAIARIDVATLPLVGVGSLRWFLTPKVLQQLGKQAP